MVIIMVIDNGNNRNLIKTPCFYFSFYLEYTIIIFERHLFSDEYYFHVPGYFIFFNSFFLHQISSTAFFQNCISWRELVFKCTLGQDSTIEANVNCVRWYLPCPSKTSDGMEILGVVSPVEESVSFREKLIASSLFAGTCWTFNATESQKC